MQTTQPNFPLFIRPERAPRLVCLAPEQVTAWEMKAASKAGGDVNQQEIIKADKERKARYDTGS